MIDLNRPLIKWISLIAFLTGCGNNIQIPEKITTESTITVDVKDNTEGGSTTAGPDGIEGACAESDLIGSWIGYHPWENLAELHVRFKSDCTLILAECGIETSYEPTAGSTGMLKFKVKKKPKNKACFAKGAHRCEFGITTKNRFSWTCDDESTAKQFYRLYE